MAENDELDPGANTEMFQAFVDRQQPEEPRSPMRAVLVGVAAVAVLVVVLIIALKLLG